jgi:uncharacterized protein (TIGR01319 family)
MQSALLIDIGSTYTKVSLLDLNNLEILGQSQAYTTVEKDVTIGLEKALSGIKDWEEANYKLSCSSAAGGLKIIALGLVPDLTAEAAKRAALGAGSKVLDTYSFEITDKQLCEMKEKNPDIILLAGGTDGGNQETITHNARMLAKSDITCPIIIAGNRVVVDKIEEILAAAEKETYLTENVMPRLEELNIEPARKTIREIFLKKIIKAKGLKKVNELIDGVIMPTPAAVLKAAALLADGHKDEAGLGELLVVDIGGATTDIHSIAKGNPTKGNVNWRGLEEPYQKRTVEGDLGMRYSAPSLLTSIGRESFKEQIEDYGTEISVDELDIHLKTLHQKVEFIPKDEKGRLIDNLLARNATRMAVERHTGIMKTVYTPMGATSIQEGKDLTKINNVVGTGGIIVNNEEPYHILEGCLYKNQDKPELLAPMDTDFLIDQKYIMAAMGLLSEVEPTKALQFMKKHFNKL